MSENIKTTVDAIAPTMKAKEKYESIKRDDFWLTAEEAIECLEEAIKCNELLTNNSKEYINDVLVDDSRIGWVVHELPYAEF